MWNALQGKELMQAHSTRGALSTAGRLKADLELLLIYVSGSTSRFEELQRMDKARYYRFDDEGPWASLWPPLTFLRLTALSHVTQGPLVSRCAGGSGSNRS